MDTSPVATCRFEKADIFDGGHRIPFIARWPGKTKAGSRCEQTILQLDLMATCQDIAGFTLPENVGEDSVSFFPALLGNEQTPVRTAVVHHSINGSFAIRQGKWKLELCADSGGWSEPKPGSSEAKELPDIQLYDLSADLAESKNLQAEYPEEVARLTLLLEEIVTNGRSTPGRSKRMTLRFKSGKRVGAAAKARKASKTK